MYLFKISLLLLCSSTFALNVELSTLNQAFSYVKAKQVFYMGSKEHEHGYFENEKRRKVKLSKDFEVLKTEVTQKLYFDVMKENPSKFSEKKYCPNSFISLYSKKKNKKMGLCPQHPVETVSFSQVQDFIKKLSHLTSKKYKLPTEAQWEYFTRAGSKGVFYYGNSLFSLRKHAIYIQTSLSSVEPIWGHTRKHGLLRSQTKGKNQLGLVDVYGNVWEWCSDWYEDFPKGGLDPQGPKNGTRKIIRGGSFGNIWEHNRSTTRYSFEPDKPNSYTGFRIIREMK